MCQANLLAMTMMAPLSRPSSVSMSTSMEIAFNCSFGIRLLLLGLLGVSPCQRHPQIPWIAGTGTPNLDPFWPLLLTVIFNQMTIKHSLYMQKVH